MTAGTHVIVALASVALCEGCTGLRPSLWAIPVIVLGALAPDIDNKGAIVRWKRWMKPVLGDALAGGIEQLLLSFSGVVRSVFGHRGFLHTPVFCSLLFAAGIALGNVGVTHFAWGYATHLAADCCTVAGIPLLGPFQRNRFSLLPIRTGSAGELLAVCVVVAFTAAYSWFSVLL
jgi:inner membrane protein